MLSERALKRLVKTFEHRPLDHIIESETVDFDNRSFAFTVFGHDRQSASAHRQLGVAPYP